jgi:hypothetical protein
MNQLEITDSIKQLQVDMKKGETIELETRHYFSDGMYARELYIPAGVCCVGATHKTRHLYTVLKGRCKVASIYGNEEIEAPFMGETLPKTKRVIYAETDCVWVTYHPTDLTSVEEIEKAILEPEDI